MDFLKSENIKKIMGVLDDVVYIYKALLKREEERETLDAAGALTDGE